MTEPTIEQITRFIELQESQAERVSDFLHLISEDVKATMSPEKWENLTSRIEEEPIDAEVRDFFHSLTRRLLVARGASTKVAKDFLKINLEELPQNQRAAAQRITGCEDEIDAIGERDAYRLILGEECLIFLRHDDAHQFGETTDLMKRAFLVERYTREEREVFKRALEDPYNAFQGLVFMKEQAAFLAAYEHGLTPRMAEIEAEPMFRTIAQIIAARGNIHTDSFGFRGNREGVEAKNMITYHSDLEFLVGNPGAIYVIAYNYAKNAGKKLFKEIEEGMHPEGARIHIGAHDISDTHYMIVCSDNGSPVCLDGFLNEVRRMYKESPEKADNVIRSFSPRAAGVFRDWSTGRNFAIHELSVGDLTELVHTGNITGIGQTYKSGSGTGLKAVRYLSEVHQGKPLYTQSFDTGGPIFGVLLSKNPTKADSDSLEKSVEVAKRKTNYVLAA